MVDVAYFCFLSLRGRPVSTSVEGYIDGDSHRPVRRVVGALKDLLVAVGYWESRLLRALPGGGGHFTCVRMA
jgi:hypothetical protein